MDNNRLDRYILHRDFKRPDGLVPLVRHRVTLMSETPGFPRLRDVVVETDGPVLRAADKKLVKKAAEAALQVAARNKYREIVSVTPHAAADGKLTWTYLPLDNDTLFGAYEKHARTLPPIRPGDPWDGRHELKYLYDRTKITGLGLGGQRKRSQRRGRGTRRRSRSKR